MAGMSVDDLLLRAIEKGALFSDFLALYARKNTDRDRELIELARETRACEGDIEIDDPTICSGSDNPDGDYVLAWVWVEK